MVAYDPAGALWVDVAGTQIWRIQADGGGTGAPLILISGATVKAIGSGPPGQLFVANSLDSIVLYQADGGAAPLPSGLASRPPCGSRVNDIAYDSRTDAIYLTSTGCSAVETGNLDGGSWTPLDAGYSQPFGVTTLNGQAYVADQSQTAILAVTDAGGAGVAGNAAQPGFFDGQNCSSPGCGFCSLFCKPGPVAVGRGEELIVVDPTIAAIRAVSLDGGFATTLIGPSQPAPSCQCLSNTGTELTGCSGMTPGFTLNFTFQQSASYLTVDEVSGDILLADLVGQRIVVIEILQ